jgi:acetolactate synthase I/II/III large subunit
MAEMRGADLVVDYLIREQTPYIFGYAGHGAVGLLDGVYHRQDEIKLVWPRMESAAGFMADAYFRATGIPIPVYTSTGPGPMLLTVAMGNAFADSSSFVAITGQVATNQFDSGALQEEYRHFSADFPSVVKPITKRSYQAHSVEDLAKIIPKAFKLARDGRPGPVHIDVPYDLWIRTGDVDPPEPADWSRHTSWRTPGTPEAVERALDLLLSARRPLILAGGGVILSDASEQLAAFAEHVNVPVYSTFMGKGALSARHPLHLGIAGCWGEYPATEAARNADVILALGCRFSDIHCSSWVPGYTYNIPPTKLIHVDLDP